MIIPFVNIAWQRYCDRKDGHDTAAERGKYLHELEAKHENTPGYYALLPVIPFVFLFGFSELFVSAIKMTIPVAMMSTMTLCIIIEALRYRSLNKAFANFEAWLTGTGMIFGSVLTLMLAAEFFSTGLTNIGAITQLIDLAKSFELNPLGLSLVFSLFILLTAFITGSGNAPVMAFIPIVPLVSSQFDINPLLLLVPILFAAGIGRTISPVAGVIITVSGIANLSPVDVVKRTFVPMMASMAVVMALTAIRYI
ncbi:C4-dicarboxylate transporter DcuC [Aeromonas jandaei]|uniref:C4-dicarboxylate transporter DcuC n=1 Tax=Aeromonas jandaei TaxID=650 RepID=UPI003986842E